MIALNPKWGLHAGNTNLDKVAGDWKNKGNWNYGPGLYVTQNYEEVTNYKKGSRALWLVTLPPNARSAFEVKLFQSDIYKIVSTFPSVIKNVTFTEGMQVSGLLAQLMNKNDDHSPAFASKVLKVMNLTSAKYTGEFYDIAAIFTPHVILRKIGPKEKFWTSEWISSMGLVKENEL